MKELSIEEKAKAYDNALKVLHKYDGANIMFSQSLKEEMFSELKELNDEKIRKALIEGFKVMKDRSYIGCTFSNYNIPVTDIIAYLEKLGEPTDIPANAILDSNKDGLIADTIRCKTEKQDEQEIKSKFHKGDWITNSQGMLRHILNVDKGGYQTDGGWLTHETYEKAFHLWTIQDAKAGDVLAVTMYTEGTWIGIFKEHNGCTFSSYCFVDTEGAFKLGTDNHGNGKAIHPATKEQRDLLFQKMHEAGYEWDVKKKELKKIEQKPIEWSDIEPIIQHLDNLGNTAMADILRSFGPKWKPSEEQLTQLYYASTGVSYSRATLLSLLEQLKKLRE